MAQKFTIEFEGKIAGLANAIDTLKGRFDTFAKTTTNSTSGIQKAFDELGTRVETTVNKATSSFTRWGVAIGALATGGGLAALTKSAVEFQSAMAYVNTMLDKTGPSFEKVNKAVLDLSANSIKSASDLSKGLYQIYSSVDGATSDLAGSMDLLDKAQKAAVAGQATTEQAVLAGTRVINAYGKEAGTATQIYDKLFRTVKDGVVEFPELAQGVGEVAGAAKAAKVDFDTMLGALAITSKVMPANEAFTALRALFGSLSAPTREAGMWAKKFGVDIGEAAVLSKGMPAVLADIVKKTGGLQEAIRLLIPEENARRAAFTLGEESGKKFADQIQRIKTSTGEMGDAYDIMSKTVGSSFEQLKKAFVEVAIKALGTGSEIKQSIDQVIQKVKEVDPAKIAAVVSSMIKILAPLAKLVGTIAYGWGQIVELAQTDVSDFVGAAGQGVGAKGPARALSYEEYRARQRGGSHQVDLTARGDRVDLTPGNTVNLSAEARAAAEKANYDAVRHGRRSMGGTAPPPEPEAATPGGGGWFLGAPEAMRSTATLADSPEVVALKKRLKSEIAAGLRGGKGRGDASRAEELKADHDYYKALEALRRQDLANEMSKFDDEIADLGEAKQRALDLVGQEADAELELAADATRKRDQEIEKNVKNEKKAQALTAESFKTFQLEKERINVEYDKRVEAIEDKARKRAESDREYEKKATLAAYQVMWEAAQIKFQRMQALRSELLKQVEKYGGAFAQGGFAGLAGATYGAGVEGLGESGARNIEGGISHFGSATNVGDKFRAAGEVLIGAAQIAGARFGNLVAQGADYLYGKFADLVDLAATTKPSEFVGKLEEKFQMARDLIDALVANLPMLFAKLEPFIREIGPKLAHAIPVIVQAFIQNIPGILQAVLDQLPALMDAVIAETPRIISALVGLLPRLIKSLLEEVIPRIPDFALAIVEGVIAAFMEHIDEIIVALAEGLYKAIVKLVDKATGGAAGAIGKLTDGDIGGFLDDAAHVGGPFNPVNWFDVGGRIESYAKGGMIGQENAVLSRMRDAATGRAGVPMIGHPGERVLRAETTKRVESMLEQAVTRGTGMGGAAQVVFKSMGGRGDRLLMELISHYVTASVNQNGRLINGVRQLASGEFPNYPRPIPALGY